MDFPILELLDEDLSKTWLLGHFHPNGLSGLSCPHCGAPQTRARLFRRTQTSQLDVYRCNDCDKTYTL